MIHLVHTVRRGAQLLEQGILALSIVVIAVLTIANVVCRTALGFSLAFAEELSQFCMISLCFVGLSYATSQGRHIRMTAIYDLLPFAWRKALMIAICATTSLIMFALTGYAAYYVSAVYKLGGIYPATRIPYWVVYAVAPLGLLLAGMHYALAVVKNATAHDIYVSFERSETAEDLVTQEI